MNNLCHICNNRDESMINTKLVIVDSGLQKLIDVSIEIKDGKEDIFRNFY